MNIMVKNIFFLVMVLLTISPVGYSQEVNSQLVSSQEIDNIIGKNYGGSEP
jgi:hypothetical protein